MNDLPSEPSEAPVAILFTDVEGSTQLGTRLGDVAAHELIEAHHELVRRHLVEHGGREVKQLGDGLMVVFTSSRRALQSAVAIQNEMARGAAAEPLRARMGLHCGEVIEHDSDLFGTAVNIAARIAAKATGGEILVSEVVRQLAGSMSDLTFRDRGRFRLKGIDERWRLYQVVTREGQVGAAIPAAAPERTPFVGRSAERSELERLLRQASDGAGAVVFVGGEPGVGKTRLAEEVGAIAAAAGFRVRIGRCYETEGAPPYVPFVEVLEAAMRDIDPDLLRSTLGDSAPEVARLLPELRRTFPDIPPPLELPAEQQRRHLFNSVCDFIVRAAAVRPQFLILDDLHWGEESTLLLVEHLAERVPGIRALVVGTFRDTELDVARPLAHTLVSLTRRRLARRITLSRLDEEGVGAMLTRLAGRPPPPAVLTEIYRETDGNAFFVEEVFRFLMDNGRLLDSNAAFRADLTVSELEVPETVRMVVGRRLEGLHEQTRTVLTAAAVAGRRFDHRLLESMQLVDGDALLDAIDEAERTRLIIATSGGPEAEFQFAHELVRQTLLTRISQPRRQRLHLSLAGALERIHAERSDQHAAEIAHHFVQAGAMADPHTTVRFLAMAGRRALDAAAHEEALRLFDGALDLSAPDDDAQRADLLVGRGTALRGLGRWEETIAAWSEALDIRERMRDLESVGSLSLDLASHLAWAFRFADSYTVAARGLGALGDRLSSDRCRLLARSGVVLSLGGFFDVATQQLTEADHMASQLGDSEAIADVAYMRTVVAYSSARALEMVDTGRHAASLLDACGMSWELSSLWSFVAFGLLFRCRLAEAEAACQERIPTTERLGHIGAALQLGRVSMCARFLTRPDPDRLLLEAQRDEQVAGQVAAANVSDSHAWQGFAHLYRGDIAAARSAMECALTLSEPGPWAGAYHGYLILALATAGDDDETRARIDDSRQRLPTPGRLNSLGAWTLAACIAEAAGMLGDAAIAGEVYPLVEEALTIGSLIHGHDCRMLHTAAGAAAGACGLWERADDHFVVARRDCDASGNRLEIPFIEWGRGRMLARRGAGHRDAARGLLQQASQSFAAIGMRYHAARAADAAAGV